MNRAVIFQDESYERITRDEINEAHEAMTKMLNAWNSLKLGPISTTSELFDLLTVPQLMFNEAVSNRQKQTDDTNRPAPGSIPPQPDAFYSAAAAAKALPYCNREYGLFSVVKGKVAIIEQAANLYIYNRTIYADTESQIEFARDVENFTKTFNSINAKMGGQLLSVPAYRRAWEMLFYLPPEGYVNTERYPAHFKTDRLRELIELM